MPLTAGPFPSLFVETFSAVLLLIAGATARHAEVAGVLPAGHEGPDYLATMAVGTELGHSVEPVDKPLHPGEVVGMTNDFCAIDDFGCFKHGSILAELCGEVRQANTVAILATAILL